MKKIFLLVVFMMSIVTLSYSQKYYDRTNGLTTPNDPHLSASLSLKIPNYSSTSTALTGAGIDSSGLIFHQSGSGLLYVRDAGTWYGVGSNFANTDLTATGNRRHIFAGHSLLIDSLSRATFALTNGNDFIISDSSNWSNIDFHFNNQGLRLGVALIDFNSSFGNLNAEIFVDSADGFLLSAGTNLVLSGISSNLNAVDSITIDAGDSIINFPELHKVNVVDTSGWKLTFIDSASRFVRGNWSSVISLLGGGGGGSYTLPTATGSVLGGVKVGSSLSISSGVLDVNTVYSSGSYTPILTNTTNLSSSSLTVAYYQKIGNIVHCILSGGLGATSSSPTFTALTFTLPFSTTNSTQQYLGQGSIADNSGTLGNVCGQVVYVSSTQAKMIWLQPDNFGANFTIEFTYSLN